MSPFQYQCLRKLAYPNTQKFSVDDFLKSLDRFVSDRDVALKDLLNLVGKGYKLLAVEKTEDGTLLFSLKISRFPIPDNILAKFTPDMIQDGLERGWFQRIDGQVWHDLTFEERPRPRVNYYEI